MFVVAGARFEPALGCEPWLGSSPATPHSLFWQNLITRGAPKPTGGLAEQIDRDFGSFDTFTREFATAAATIMA